MTLWDRISPHLGWRKETQTDAAARIRALSDTFNVPNAPAHAGKGVILLDGYLMTIVELRPNPSEPTVSGWDATIDLRQSQLDLGPDGEHFTFSINPRSGLPHGRLRYSQTAPIIINIRDNLSMNATVQDVLGARQTGTMQGVFAAYNNDVTATRNGMKTLTKALMSYKRTYCEAI